MCFVHKHIWKTLILGEFWPTCDYQMSHDVAPGCLIFANLGSKAAQDFKEIVMERRIATKLCGGRETAEDFVPGGGGGGVKFI